MLITDLQKWHVYNIYILQEIITKDYAKSAILHVLYIDRLLENVKNNSIHRFRSRIGRLDLGERCASSKLKV